jgi:IstB-like ATP binding protein
VRAALHSEVPPRYVRSPRGSVVDATEPQIRVLLSEFPRMPAFEAEAANLFIQLASTRYERASVIVTSDKPFGRWGAVFGTSWSPPP